jgi:pimeloyl-ACP methyl ester carboxylesterase
VGNLYRTPAGQEQIRSWCTAQLDRWTVPHERRTVPTALGETHLVVAGDGPATVLYLPGTNFNAATSKRLMTELTGGFRVVAADLPGQPGLSAAERPRDRSTYGTWVDEIVAHLGPDAPVLAGHSLGAAAALMADPAAVRSLVLLDPAGVIRLRVPPATLAATVAWLGRRTSTSSARLLRHMHARHHAPSRGYVEWMTLVARQVRTSLAPSPLSRAVVDRWRGTPRAVLSGEQDCFLPVRPLTRAVRAGLGIELEVVAGAGHLVPEDQPRKVADRISGLA